MPNTSKNIEMLQSKLLIEGLLQILERPLGFLSQKWVRILLSWFDSILFYQLGKLKNWTSFHNWYKRSGNCTQVPYKPTIKLAQLIKTYISWIKCGSGQILILSICPSSIYIFQDDTIYLKKYILSVLKRHFWKSVYKPYFCNCFNIYLKASSCLGFFLLL